jgi:hypothetical protein
MRRRSEIRLSATFRWEEEIVSIIDDDNRTLTLEVAASNPETYGLGTALEPLDAAARVALNPTPDRV